MIEAFQGYFLPDSEIFDPKETEFTQEEWEFWLDVVYLQKINCYVPLNRVLDKVEDILDLYWYHPGLCYAPGPITQRFLDKCCVKFHCNNECTLVGGDQKSAKPPKDWFTTLFPDIEPDESPFRGRVSAQTSKV